MKISIHEPITISELGCRDRQEDTVSPAPGVSSADNRLFVLCDGMGGHENGDKASRVVCDTVVSYVREHWQADRPLTDEVLTEAVRQARQTINGLSDGKGRGMGTTLTLVALHVGGCTAMNLGDSRIYHLRTSEKQWKYISRDHSLVFDLYQAGEITYEEMRSSQQKNIITKAVRAGDDRNPLPDIVHIGELHDGDYLFMCSDGMLEQIDDDALLRLLCSGQTDHEKALSLVRMAKGSHDNHSAHLIHIRRVENDGKGTVADDEHTSRCNALNVVPKNAGKRQEKTAEPQHLPQQRSHYRRLLWLALALATAAATLLFFI